MFDIPGYQTVRILGKGSFGTVYQCIKKGDDTQCAVKMVIPTVTKIKLALADDQ